MFSAPTIDIHTQLTSELNILIETRKSRKHSMAIILLLYYVGDIPSMSG